MSGWLYIIRFISKFRYVNYCLVYNCNLLKIYISEFNYSLQMLVYVCKYLTNVICLERKNVFLL